MKTAGSGGRAGFTLIEVLVSLVVIGLVGGTLAFVWGNAFRGRSWAFKKDYHANAMALAMRQIQSDLSQSTRLDMTSNTQWLRGGINIDKDGCFPTADTNSPVGYPTWYWYCITDGTTNPASGQVERQLYRYASSMTDRNIYPGCPWENRSNPTFGEPISGSTVYYPSMPSGCGGTLSDGSAPTLLMGGITAGAFSTDARYKGQVAVKLEINKPGTGQTGSRPINESVDVKLRVQQGQNLQ